MNCPKCNAVIEPSALVAPPRGQIARAILLDWRVWVFAFVVMGVCSYLSQLVGQPSVGTIVGGGLTGMIVAIRMGRLRQCPSCHATISAVVPAT